MNKHLIILIIFVGLFSTTLNALATNGDQTFTVSVTQNSEPYYVDDGPVRQRIPSKSIICTICPNGIFIPSITVDDILYYEVYSLDNECLATCLSVTDFISLIYSVTETVEIRIHIDGYVFHGYIDF